MARSLRWAVVSGFGAVALLSMLPSACRSVAGLPGDEPFVDASLDSWADGRPSYPLCQEYCSTVKTNCQGSLYTDDETCAAVCSVLPAGMPGDKGGDSIECRLTAAKVGTKESCQVASPISDKTGICGDRCRNYCNLLSALCSPFYQNMFGGDRETCESACQKFPDMGGADYSVTPADSHDSLQCRVYHLTSASIEPDHHCPHAVGFGMCPPPDVGSQGGGGQGGGGQGGGGQGGSGQAGGQGGGGQGGSTVDAGTKTDAGTTTDGGTKTDGG